MVIEIPDSFTDNKQRIRADLEMLLAQPGPHQVPPCPNCRNHIVEQCHAKCPEAPHALSSDPDNYPLEPKVLPLVYELRKTRVIQPCWSCEGHMDQNGNLWKYPQVCFYARSPIYAILLVNYFTLLKHKKLMCNDWHIVLSEFGQKHGAITYTIEPKLYPGTDPHLGSMQADLVTFAENLNQQIRAFARETIEELG